MSEETGLVSKWNEASLKSERLHETQVIMNSLKTDPLAITNGKFNYVWLVYHIDILYHEGYSKYSAKEREDVDKTRKLIFDVIEYVTPTRVVQNQSMAGSVQSFSVDREKYNKMMDLILIFERKVKDANDKHGLTTYNEEEEGGWD